MPRDLPADDSKVFHFIADKISAPILDGARMSALPGGAVLRHFRLEFAVREGRFAGPQSWVLRADGATKLGIVLARAQEFALQRALLKAGLNVAEPLFMCCDESIFGAPFFLMRSLAGEADGAALVAQGRNENL